MRKVKQLTTVNFTEQYVSREEVSKLLKISLSTIYNWSNKEILHPSHIDRRVYFKASDIESSMIKLER